MRSKQVRYVETKVDVPMIYCDSCKNNVEQKDVNKGWGVFTYKCSDGRKLELDVCPNCARVKFPERTK